MSGGDDIFCKLYSSWRNEGKIIYENDFAFSIFSVTPAIAGQMMVIPKRCVDEYTLLNGDELVGLFDVVKKSFNELQNKYKNNEIDVLRRVYQQMMENPPTLSTKSLAKQVLSDKLFDKMPVAYNLGINVGKEAGQLVGHVHVHLFPKREEGTGIVTAVRNDYWGE